MATGVSPETANAMVTANNKTSTAPMLDEEEAPKGEGRKSGVPVSHGENIIQMTPTEYRPLPALGLALSLALALGVAEFICKLFIMYS